MLNKSKNMPGKCKVNIKRQKLGENNVSNRTHAPFSFWGGANVWRASATNHIFPHKIRNCCEWHANERYKLQNPCREDGNKRFKLQAVANTRSMEMTRSGSEMSLLASWLLRFLWLYCGSIVTHCGFLDCWLHRGVLAFSVKISVPAKRVTTTQQQ